ncbi:hypothetical protein NMQ01_06195 [Janibacter sp. CX7]|uniref:hypothetical protein n=1 Tax=Janibacter sp. CX7 TaxID=2963431 RepID=UPI0020CFB01E|nr:hypothetical protein [Janibacter sp. CX7]UTT67300.1 hypothetical protein NMQ01_06195 [Janibacter sp. CX7]
MDSTTIGTLMVIAGGAHQMSTALTPLNALRQVLESDEGWSDLAKDPTYQFLALVFTLIALAFAPQSPAVVILFLGGTAISALLALRLLILTAAFPQRIFPIRIDETLSADDQDLLSKGPPSFIGWMLVVMGSSVLLWNSMGAAISAIAVGFVSGLLANKQRQEVLATRFRSRYIGGRGTRRS